MRSSPSSAETVAGIDVFEPDSQNVLSPSFGAVRAFTLRETPVGTPSPNCERRNSTGDTEDSSIGNDVFGPVPPLCSLPLNFSCR
jgi:hypothetical protein